MDNFSVTCFVAKKLATKQSTPKLPFTLALCALLTMKYKNIISAIHNFGHSFASYENYVDDDFVLYEMKNIRRKGYDIHINWLTRQFEPAQLESERLKKSISYWADSLEAQFRSQNVDLESIRELNFYWPKNEQHYIIALDDRGVKHKKLITYAD